MSITSVLVAAGYNAASGQALASGALDTRNAKAILVFGGWELGPLSANAYAAITDTAGNTYTPAGRLNNAAAGTEAQCWYCVAPTGNATNVVTMTPSANRTFRAVRQVAIVSDGALTFSTSATPVAGSASTTVAVGPINASSNGIIVAGQHKYDNNTANTTGIAGSLGGAYTLDASNEKHLAVGYKAVTSALATETVTATTDAANTYSVLFAIYLTEAANRRRLLGALISGMSAAVIASAIGGTYTESGYVEPGYWE